ncbi:hypothetical protein [Runella sp.]|uniref:hypothetical protein n=1 Tax=Runella sp. TaxID=1960881 RepID=UPI003D0ED042
MATNNNRGTSRAANKRETGEVKQDPSWFITCLVKDPVKSFTITFDPKALSQKREKYGDRLIVPQGVE